MLDHHAARLWADHHAAFGAWVARLGAQVRQAFEVLVRIQYAAPWQVADRCDGDAPAIPASQSDASAARCPA